MTLNEEIISFEKETKERTILELIFEFVIWDYKDCEVELQYIKSELKQRGVSTARFIFTAFLINLSICFIEVYYERWEFFEQKKIDIYREIVIGLLLSFLILLPFLVILLLEQPGVYLSIFFALLISAYPLFVFYKTFKDGQSY